MHATRATESARLLLAVAILAVAGGCGESPKIETEPTVVIVSKPLQQDVQDFADFPGRTDAAMSVILRSRVTGYLMSFDFKVGSEVKKDALLFQIDPREYDAALERAQADVLICQANLKLANADLERAKRLLPKGAVSQEDFDKYTASAAEADASLASAKAKVDQAKLNVEFTRITAPFAGEIGRNLIDIGNLVTADVTELGNIVTVDPVYVYFDIDERTMLRLQRMLISGKIPGAKDNAFPVMVRLADETDYTHKAMIDFINNRVDPNTGTIRLRAVLPNPIVGNGHRQFASGLFARVRLPIGPPFKALEVMDRAIMSQQGQKYVYTVNAKNEVQYRPVTTGTVHNGLRVIEKGIDPDDRVIISGLQMVRPGIVVTPKPGPMRPQEDDASTDQAPTENAKPAKPDENTKPEAKPEPAANPKPAASAEPAKK